MRVSSSWVIALCLLGAIALAGCMISDQTGQMPQRLPGYGSGYSAPEDIAFHFDSGFNWGIVLGRSGLLLIVAACFARTSGRDIAVRTAAACFAFAPGRVHAARTAAATRSRYSDRACPGNRRSTSTTFRR